MSRTIKFAMLTDLHYYSKKNWIDTDPYKFPARTDNVYIRGSEEIVRDVFEKLKKDKELKYILFGGDITQLAECTSHEEITALLSDLKNSGKKVYVITATHDFMQSGVSVGYDKDNNEVDVPAVKREELCDLYKSFGFDEAIEFDKESMSYVVQLEEGFRLLALNDDFGDKNCGYTDRCFAWIEEQIKNAKKDGQFIIAMTHHPIIPHSPLYPLIASTDMLENANQRINQFAEAGLHLIFTGHTHSHNISCRKAQNGTAFYAVSTAALTGYPPGYRIVSCDAEKNTAEIETVWLKEANGLDTDGKTLPEYIKNIFLGFVDKFIGSCLNDYDDFVHMANNEFSMDEGFLRKNRKIIQAAFRFVNDLTYKKIWRIAKKESGLKRKEIEHIADKKIIPVIINTVAGLFDGQAHYSKSDAEYKITAGFLAVIDSIIKPFSRLLYKKLGFKSISEVILPLLGGSETDHAQAVLHLDEVIERKPVQQVKSSKGFFILTVLILLLIILLPLVLISGAVFFTVSHIRSKVS